MSLYQRVIKAFKSIFKASVKKSRKSRKTVKKVKRSALAKKSSRGRKRFHPAAKSKTIPRKAKSADSLPKRRAQAKIRIKAKENDTKKIPGSKPLGEVTHYFDKIKVCVIRIDRGTLSKGDRLIIKGKNGSLTQLVDSMQIENEDVSVARKGQLIGLKVSKQVSVGDSVDKL